MQFAVSPRIRETAPLVTAINGDRRTWREALRRHEFGDFTARAVIYGGAFAQPSSAAANRRSTLQRPFCGRLRPASPMARRAIHKNGLRAISMVIYGAPEGAAKVHREYGVRTARAAIYGASAEDVGKPALWRGEPSIDYGDFTMPMAI